MDAMMRGGFTTVVGTSSSPYPQMIPRGNSASTTIAPSGVSRGPTSSDNQLEGDINLGGRLSLGLIEAFVLVLVLAYLWTRNVQGGG